jgi:hypothetical protein
VNVDPDLHPHFYLMKIMDLDSKGRVIGEKFANVGAATVKDAVKTAMANMSKGVDSIVIEEVEEIF